MKLLSVLDHSSRLRGGAFPTAADRPADLSVLAARIERHGVEAVADEVLAEVALRGRADGLHPEVAAVLADNAAPAVVRSRVFGLIHRRLAANPLGTDPVSLAA